MKKEKFDFIKINTRRNSQLNIQEIISKKRDKQELSKEEIDYYIDKYKPYDKAGSYGIQEWIGYIGITCIEGSYFNVMGLPVQKLYQKLKSFNNE